MADTSAKVFAKWLAPVARGQRLSRKPQVRACGFLFQSADNLHDTAPPSPAAASLCCRFFTKRRCLLRSVSHFNPAGFGSRAVADFFSTACFGRLLRLL